MRAYLDNAATTQLSFEVKQAMLPWMENEWGNPSSIHVPGRRAKRAVSTARKQVASELEVEENEIYFTSGGTEADNWAIIGTAMANRERGKHVITSSIEHPAILKSCKWLESMGWRVSYLPVDEKGYVDPEMLVNVIGGETSLISVMLANNEIGTVEPIREISSIVHRRAFDLDRDIYVHTDAVQAVGMLPIKPDTLGCDMLSLSGHKFHGPKGTGVLYVKNGTKIDPIIHGGGQQLDMRSGTENVAGIVGLGKAIELAGIVKEWQLDKMKSQRDRLLFELTQKIPDIHTNGSFENRLCNNLSITIPGIEAEVLLMALDIAGIYCSAGSACSSNGAQVSHVLKAIGLSDEQARSTIRMTLSTYTTDEEIDYVIGVMPQLVADLRKSYSN